ncbi:MAG: hypothetical protein E7633_07910 [Ruminococcaceae bacterium]|nr:hypothetical protein [Oscillospiraceae bacterium]
MKSFDEFGFEIKTNNTDNNAPLANDFITRRKNVQETSVKEEAEEIKENTEVKDVAVSEQQTFAVEEKIPEMTVVSIKGKQPQKVTTVFKEKKNSFVTDNILEKKKKSMPFKTIAVLAFVFVLSVFIVNEYVLINEYSSDIADMKNMINELSEEKSYYVSQIEKKNNMIDIEKYASGELGMMSGGEVEKEYIIIEGEDSIEVYEPTKDAQDSLASIVMSALSENLIQAWNTLTGAE